MLKKICDNCKKDIINISSYDEDTFTLQIIDDADNVITWNGDLCDNCKQKIIDKITTMLENYSISKNDESEKI